VIITQISQGDPRDETQRTGGDVTGMEREHRAKAEPFQEADPDTREKILEDVENEVMARHRRERQMGTPKSPPSIKQSYPTELLQPSLELLGQRPGIRQASFRPWLRQDMLRSQPSQSRCSGRFPKRLPTGILRSRKVQKRTVLELGHT